MSNSEKLRQAVERAVRDVFQAHVPALTSELIDSAGRELGPWAAEPVPVAASAGDTPTGGTLTGLLNAAFATIVDCQSQAEILAALLDGTTKFSRRSALFVVKAGTASGWRARGFNDNDAIKSISFDPTAGLAGRAYTYRQPAQAAAAEFDSGFIAKFGEPLVGTNAIILPLVLRDKVAALVYADGGTAGTMDPAALDCLTRAASLWLEIVAARKSGTAVAPVEVSAESERTQTREVTPIADAPTPPMTSAVPLSESADVAPPAPDSEAAFASAAAEETAGSIATAAPDSAGSAADDELHKKAKRFARLLVDDIKLYNQQKVSEGRAHGDLYRRLKDDIDKSRASYEKRYGQTAAASGNYFSQELIRILCEGDASLLGSGFSS